jgi:hypothetical protein
MKYFNKRPSFLFIIVTVLLAVSVLILARQHKADHELRTRIASHAMGETASRISHLSAFLNELASYEPSALYEVITSNGDMYPATALGSPLKALAEKHEMLFDPNTFLQLRDSWQNPLCIKIDRRLMQTNTSGGIDKGVKISVHCLKWNAGKVSAGDEDVVFPQSIVIWSK